MPDATYTSCRLGSCCEMLLYSKASQAKDAAWRLAVAKLVNGLHMADRKQPYTAGMLSNPDCNSPFKIPPKTCPLKLTCRRQQASLQGAKCFTAQMDACMVISSSSPPALVLKSG